MAPLLHTKNMSISFGGLKALNNVNMHINEGEILGLIGPNGAGKTTLFNVITGFLKADSGEIIFGDEDILGLKPHSISRKGIGRTFQLVKTFDNMTALENVCVGSLMLTASVPDAIASAEAVLNLVGLTKKKDDLVSELTLMERKTVELARVLATKPKLLLLDELMTGLNPKEMDESIDLVRKISEEGVTVCIVEHVMRVIMAISDRIVVLNFGEKIADGSPREVANDRMVIDAYLGEEIDVA